MLAGLRSEIAQLLERRPCGVESRDCRFMARISRAPASKFGFLRGREAVIALREPGGRSRFNRFTIGGFLAIAAFHGVSSEIGPRRVLTPWRSKNSAQRRMP